MLNAVVGNLTTIAGTGTQVVSGLGFSPKILLMWGEGLVGTASSANSNLTFGVGTSSSSRRSISVRSADSVTTTAVDPSQRDDCIWVQSSAGAIVRKVDLTSLDSNGFTLNFITNPAASFSIPYLALGGSDLTNVAIGSAQRPTTNGHQSITGLGFQPTCVILFASTSTATTPFTGSQDSGGSIGWATAPLTTQTYTSFYQKNAVSTSVTASGDQAGNIITYTTGTSVTAQAALLSFDSGGFTLNWTTTNATAGYFYYLALAGPSFDNGTLAQPGSNGNQSITGLTNAAASTFTPNAILFMGADAVAQVPTASMAFSFGGADNGGNQAHIWAGDTNALSTTNASQDLDQTKCIKNLTPGHGSPATNSAASFAGPQLGGFTVNWTSTDATARVTQYLAIGPVPAPPGQPWIL